MRSSHGRAQSSRYGYGYLVYIFTGDAQRMKRNYDQIWDLYGLWTHSSSPVVQYICEEGNRSQAERLGLELLGQCIPQSKGRGHRRHGHERWLVILNDGVELKAALVQQDDLAPINCFIKELPMESPFVKFTSGRARQDRRRSPDRRAIEGPRERNVPVGSYNDRASKSPERPLQWYTTSSGEETLRNIYNQCTRTFPAPSQVEMSRDSVRHNMQLTIQHNQKTYHVYFPSNFPQSSAHVAYRTFYMDKKVPAKTTEEILRTIKNECGCYRCRRY